MTQVAPRILVVDDEKRLCRSLEILLKEEGPFQVVTASDYYTALERLKDGTDLVLTDLTMPGKSGIDLLRAIRTEFPDLPVILMTAYSTVESAVTAMKDGATDYIVKPFENDKLIALIRKSLRHNGAALTSTVTTSRMDRYGDLLGGSAAMQSVYNQIQRASETDSTVLITGESGTGKELVARATHYSGTRKSKPFVAINCMAVPESLLESELFGHEKGAFSGAHRLREGKFELAHTGTLFLDEIGDMAPSLQAKLLRVLQEKEFMRVGGNKEISVDVRIIAATNRDLGQAVKQGQFREDLFYRLHVVVIHLIPLRERAEDLPALVDHFLTEKCRRSGVNTKTLSESARAALLQYRYPGNVRELENMIERAIVMSRGNQIEIQDLPLGPADSVSSLDRLTLPVQGGLPVLDQMHQKLERDLIERALRSHPDKSNTELADLLGTSRRVLESRMRFYKIAKA